MSWFRSQDWRVSVKMKLGACSRKCDPMMDLGCLLLSAWAPNLQSRRALLQRNQAYVTEELVEPLGGNRFARSPGHYMSPRLGSYLQPPSLGSPHLQMTAPSAQWCYKKLGCVLGTLGKGEGEETQDVCVSSGTFHSSWQSMNRVFHETQCLRTRVGQEAMLFP